MPQTECLWKVCRSHFPGTGAVAQWGRYFALNVANQSPIPGPSMVLQAPPQVTLEHCRCGLGLKQKNAIPWPMHKAGRSPWDTGINSDTIGDSILSSLVLHKPGYCETAPHPHPIPVLVLATGTPWMA